MAAVGEAADQVGRTQELAKRLTALLDERKLDSIAARDPNDPNQFVAALYFPGSQLLVVRAKYAAPALLNEKILKGQYRDVYIDLNAASDPSTKILVEDMMADGLKARRQDDEPFDSFSKGRGDRYAFDGEWDDRKIKEEDYFKTFAGVEQEYAQMLETLITQLTQPAEPAAPAQPMQPVPQAQ
ncbi:MAG TPA: hypothetical protein VNK41_03095 [Vicinamibacterales bacterium]|nr:hypothetical protein [Vicinamibacterales bacterium]